VEFDLIEVVRARCASARADASEQF